MPCAGQKGKNVEFVFIITILILYLTDHYVMKKLKNCSEFEYMDNFMSSNLLGIF